MTSTDLTTNLQRLGDFGRYQKGQHALHLLCWLVAGVHSMSYVFVFPRMEHRCYVEELDGPLANESAKVEFLANYFPSNSDGCSMFENEDKISIIPCPKGFVYSGHDFKSSRVEDWDLVCKQKWKGPFIQSLFQVGALVGAIIAGALADKFGRKATVLFFAFGQLISGLVGVYLTSYWLLLVSIFFYGLCGSAGTVVPSITLTMEIVGQSKRSLCGILFAFAFSLGSIMVAGWAWVFPGNAKHLQLIYALHSLLLCLHFCLLDESICWLWTVGRKDEALEIIRKAEKCNGKTLDEIELAPINTMREDAISSGPIESDVSARVQRRGLTDLFKYREIRKRLLVMCYTWFSNSAMYFSLIYSSVSLSGNPYGIFILNMLVEVPGNLLVIYLVPRRGNKAVLCTALALSAVGYIVLLFCNKGLLSIILSLITKVVVTASFNVTNAYTAELFPTEIRNTGVGLCMMGSRFGAAIAPVFIFLNLTDIWLSLDTIISLLAVAVTIRVASTMDRQKKSKEEKVPCLMSIQRLFKALQSDDTDPKNIENWYLRNFERCCRRTIDWRFEKNTTTERFCHLYLEENVVAGAPNMLNSAIGISACLLVFLCIPETLNQPIPQRIDEVEGKYMEKRAGKNTIANGRMPVA